MLDFIMINFNIDIFFTAKEFWIKFKNINIKENFGRNNDLKLKNAILELVENKNSVE